MRRTCGALVVLLCVLVGSMATAGLGGSAARASGATLYVATSGGDTSNCQNPAQPCETIAYAVGQAVDSDLIQVAAGTYRENPLVQKSITIAGAGQGATVIDGGKLNHTLWFAAGAQATIEDLAVQNGEAEFGGGIYTTAISVTLNHVTVSGNFADVGSTPEGGGLYAVAGNLTLENSAVTGNEAIGLAGTAAAAGSDGGQGEAGVGGGIFATGGNLTIAYSTISGNQAIGGRGGDGGAGGSGQSGGNGGGGGYALGGGLFVQGSTGGPATVSITHTTVGSNVARSGAGGAGGAATSGPGGAGGAPNPGVSPIGFTASGGGMYIEGSTLTMSSTIVTGNSARDGAGGVGGAGTTGGDGGYNGVLNQYVCEAVGGGLVLANQPGGPPATAAIIDSRIVSNSAHGSNGGKGGRGLAGAPGYFALTGGGGGPGGAGGPASAGGVATYGPMTIANTTIAGNTAQGGRGGRGGNGGTGGKGSIGGNGGDGGGGGGIYGAFAGGLLGSPVITASTFANNAAIGGAGGAGGGGGGGGASMGPGFAGGSGGNGGYGANLYLAEDRGTSGGGLEVGDSLTPLTNTTIVGNRALGGIGGNGGPGGSPGTGPAGLGSPGLIGRGGGGENASGGGVLANTDISFDLANDTIRGNSAAGGSFGTGEPYGQPANGTGGGIYGGGGAKLSNMIIAQNTVREGSYSSADCAGNWTSGGGNIVGDGGGCSGIVSGTNGDLVGTSVSPIDPLLASLGAYGGTTQTMAEKVGSPAILHGSATTCQSSAVGDVDQRGYPRLSGARGGCDAGAYDTAEPEKLVLGAPTTATHGVSFTITVTAKDPFGATITGFSDTVRFTSTDSAAVLPRRYTFTTSDGGMHTFTVTLKTVGAQKITAIDVRSGLIRGFTGTISVS